MNKVIKYVTTAVSVLAGFVGTATAADWRSDYWAAKKEAESTHKPMLTFWSSSGCGYCMKLENACKTDAFNAWADKKKMIMVHVVNDQDVKVDVRNDTKKFPYVRVYWPKEDGTVVDGRFSGRDGKMPVKSGDLCGQFTASIDYYTPGWNPDKPEPKPEPVGYIGGEFVVPGTEASHLEAITGITETVAVPLVRTNGVEFAATNILVAGDSAIDVVWQSGESEKMITVTTVGLAAGTELELTLKYGAAVHATSFVRIVDAPANSTDNPAWLDEDFDFGEWTMDLALAKQKTAAATGNAHTLVFFTGVQWCPWCLGLEKFVFATDEFKEWARTNQINLVLLDNPKRSANDKTSGDDLQVSAVANGAAPTLLRYGTGANGRSGAAYLSRKGIAKAAAEAKLLANHTMGYLDGAYCAPEALRTGYPTLILLDKAGEVKGRLNYQADSSAGKDADGAYFCDKDENMQRLKDLLALSECSDNMETDKYWSTTTLVHELGTQSETTLHVNESVNVYRLDGVDKQSVTFSAIADSAHYGVEFTVVRATVSTVKRIAADGTTIETVNVPSSAVVATGKGSLICDFVESGNYYLKVSSFGTARTEKYGSLSSSTVSFSSFGLPLDTDNEYVDKQVSSLSIPLSQSGTAVGVLTVSTTRRGRVTAKYSSSESTKTISLSGYWSEPDAYGTARMVATKSGVTVAMSLRADGTMAVELEDSAWGATALAGVVSMADIDYLRYYGLYTVALPVEGISAPISASTGAGTVIVKANSSSFRRTGKVACTVTFPDGKVTSGNGQLVMGEGGFANLTLFVKSGKNAMIIPMQIRPDAATLAPTHRAVVAQRDTKALWKCSNRTLEFSASCGIYGSTYNKSESLVDCCGSSLLAIAYDTSLVADSEVYGAISSVLGDSALLDVASNKFSLKERVSGMRISLSRSTGLVTGSTKLAFEDGKTVAVKIRAVVMPDWHDCGCFEDDEVVPLSVDLPFVFGGCAFSDKVSRQSVSRGFPVGFVAVDK